MNVIFYNIACDNRVVDKTSALGTGVTKECKVYQQTGIMHPSILLAYGSSIVNYNYMEIPSWNRYYFITGMEVMPGERIVVTGSEDVLFSNKDEILQLNAYVVRSEDHVNKLIVDNKHPVQANRHCKTIKFPTAHFGADPRDRVYLLTVVGGVSQ